jgi:t-SNARE complex subunit (syntaxin)
MRREITRRLSLKVSYWLGLGLLESALNIRDKRKDKPFKIIIIIIIIIIIGVFV